jgi:glutaredoxin
MAVGRALLPHLGLKRSAAWVRLDLLHVLTGFPMTRTLRPASSASPLLRTLPWVLLLAGLWVAAPSHAMYKVIGPDGKVTYTDRPPSASQGRVSPLSGQSAPASLDVVLPLDLRQAIGKFPVILYTVTGTCGPCDNAKQLLRGRGIPYSEKQVVSAEDSEALQRLSGGQDAPTLAIGSQILRGLAPEVWNSYLDAAGYPRESRLPTGYQYPAAAPLTERREPAPRAAAAPASAASAPPTASATTPPPPLQSGIRF